MYGKEHKGGEQGNARSRQGEEFDQGRPIQSHDSRRATSAIEEQH